MNTEIMKLEAKPYSVKQLLQNNNFLIPNYQRPYSWDEDQCQALWDDLLSLETNDNSCDIKVLSNSNQSNNGQNNYFLGTVVFCTEEGKNEIDVIDGQQRLITLILLLKAFYVFFNMEEKNTYVQGLLGDIEKCIWNDDGSYGIQRNNPRIKTEVITEEDREELNKILILENNKIENIEEELKGCKSQYADNYKFFLEQVKKYLHTHAATGIIKFPKKY